MAQSTVFATVLMERSTALGQRMEPFVSGSTLLGRATDCGAVLMRLSLLAITMATVIVTVRPFPKESFFSHTISNEILSLGFVHTVYILG